MAIVRINTSSNLGGLTIEFYKTFMEELSPKLERLFHCSLQEKVITASWNEAMLILIPKPHKDCKNN